MNMMIISDSFKGTISSEKISNLFEDSFKKYFKNNKLLKVKVADGGEGTIDAFRDYLPGRDITLEVSGPHFERLNASYYLTNDNIAIVEVASCASLPLAGSNLNPKITTTYGVGEEIKDAINKGAKQIILCLGGSSTNDAACGALCAIGTKFYNKNKEEFVPTGGTLNEIVDIDNSETEKLVNGVEFVLMSDCLNPCYGEMGAAYTFGPQKGANEDDVKLLDYNLKYLSELIKNKYKIDYSNVEGAGAAGAFGFGAMSLLNAKMKSGIDTLLEYIKFDDLLEDIDLVFTGEGRFDSQSLNGKVISGILKHTKKKNIPVVIVSGSVKKDVENINKDDYLIKGIFSTNRMAVDYSIAKYDQEENYKNTIDSILSLLSINNK